MPSGHYNNKLFSSDIFWDALAEKKQKEKIQAAINAKWMSEYVEKLLSTIRGRINTRNFNYVIFCNSLINFQSTFFINGRKIFCKDSTNVLTVIKILKLYYEMQRENNEPNIENKINKFIELLEQFVNLP